MLAYTNRFLALSQLIRELHRDYKEKKSVKTLNQIKHLRYRVFLIRLMQALGAIAIIFCVLSILCLLNKKEGVSLFFFYGSLVIFLSSILSSLIEILLSTKALNILLSDIEES